MIIELYSTKSKTNSITKKLDGLLRYEGHLQAECDLINPVITFTYNEQILTKNYAVMLGKSYFISNFVINGKTITAHLKEDVLRTYADDIKKATGYAIRSSSGSFWLPDEMVKKQTRITYQYRKLGDGLRKGVSYILIVGGRP